MARSLILLVNSTRRSVTKRSPSWACSRMRCNRCALHGACSQYGCQYGIQQSSTNVAMWLGRMPFASMGSMLRLAHIPHQLSVSLATVYSHCRRQA